MSSPIKIIFEILSLLNKSSITIDNLIAETKINPKIMKIYLELLEEKGLLKKEKLIDKNSYSTTNLGTQYLQDYQNIMSTIKKPNFHILN
jgi:predicted transcriptional regulator